MANKTTHTTNYDVLIIGAGISGICAGYYVQKKCPNQTFAIVEARENMGGTWDLFNYPGIRCDSDMYTLSFPFYPWKKTQAVANGASILQYLKDTAKTFGLDKRIQFGRKVIGLEWKDTDKYWTVRIAENGTENIKVIHAKFVISCTGYYRYDKGHTPNFRGTKDFKGQIIHPQKWDNTIDYSNKKIVVIGSGATAVTLVPTLAQKAQKVTMLQRSPTYMLSVPSKDPFASVFNKILPTQTAYNFNRWRNMRIALLLYKVSRKFPKLMRGVLTKMVKTQLGNSYKEADFNPRYEPWDQRICLVPDSDFFKAIKNGTANIVTDTIERFTENGILLHSGKTLQADIVVTATGLQLQMMGGIKATINNEKVCTGDLITYKGVMYGNVPNLAFILGYTNASWTLKANLAAQYISRLLNYMNTHNFSVVTPALNTKETALKPLLDFEANYVKRALDILPKQGTSDPWKMYQDYIKDTNMLSESVINDNHLAFL